MTQATGFVVLLASGMDARTSMGILQGLVRKLDDASIAEFDKIKNRFERLYKRRNVVAHSNWREGKRPKSISATALKSVGDVRLEVSEYTALEMIAVAHRIHAFRSDIVKFFRARGLWKTAPSPKKPTSPNPQSTGETE
ncbi:MAG TPA: hypothetical protein VHZ29_19295 [Rhizomicrobium sp.]|nr:hypothetical protein [Rhizomicrobium sp.]